MTSDSSDVTSPTLYIDLASPYAYLAAERVGSLFAAPVAFAPVLLGAIFKLRGWGSWAATDRRRDGMEEIEARARSYGLPPVVWPAVWPGNSLAANRAAIWADQQGAAEGFILALYRREFLLGADISDRSVLAGVGEEVGLDGPELLDAIQRAGVKDALRHGTEEAWNVGVRGVPTLKVGDKLFYGDDQLELAAARVAG